MHCSARSSGTFGTTEWSAYRTSPLRSAAVVFTHGMPAARVLPAQQVADVVALPISRKVSTVRRCSALASRIAQTLAGDHGISRPGASMT